MPYPFIPNTSSDQSAMLSALGKRSFAELLSIPEDYLFRGEYALPPAAAEWEIIQKVNALAGQNVLPGLSFIGAGAYDHFVPQAVDQILLRSEFFTAYTPYQAEVSQGTLQSIFEFQTMVVRLAGMEITNASLYDGAVSLAEAVAMCKAIRNREGTVLVPATLHPYYTAVLRTYCRGWNLALKEVPAAEDGRLDLNAAARSMDQDTIALITQQPNFFGVVEDLATVSTLVKEKKCLWVVQNDLLSSALLEPPGSFGADVVTGEMHYFGAPLSFGGPFLGYLATRRQYLRQMPGRVVGLTEDAQGKRGFVLTAQTREQHIRREKALSNVCTNQGLMALAATIHLALLGKQGVPEQARNSALNAAYACSRIAALPGVKRLYTAPFFREFAVTLDAAREKSVREKAAQAHIVPGFWLEKMNPKWKSRLLICVTEKKNREQIDQLVHLFT